MYCELTLCTAHSDIEIPICRYITLSIHVPCLGVNHKAPVCVSTKFTGKMKELKDQYFSKINHLVSGEVVFFSREGGWLC